MAILVQLIADYAPWVYGACALVALRYLWVVYQARQERKQAVFSLEREAALNRIYNAYIVAFVLLAIMGVVYFISTYLTEAVEPLVKQVFTPTPGVLNSTYAPSMTINMRKPRTYIDVSQYASDSDQVGAMRVIVPRW